MPPKKTQLIVAKSKVYFGLSGAVYPRLQKDIAFELHYKNIAGPKNAGNDKWNALLDQIQDNKVFRGKEAKFLNNKDTVRHYLLVLCVDMSKKKKSQPKRLKMKRFSREKLLRGGPTIMGRKQKEEEGEKEKNNDNNHGMLCDV